MDSNQQLIDKNVELLNNFKSNILPCIQSAKKLLDKLKENQLSTENGISLFNAKNELFSSYLIDLVHMINLKLNNREIDGAPVVNRLVEERVFLEKMRPLENKLKYQVDKMMKIANTGQLDENDSINLKPNFSNMIDDEEDEEMSDNETSKEHSVDNSMPSKKDNKKLYVPPRLAQMKFEDEEEKRAKVLSQAKKRAMNTSIMKELRREFDDTPEEEYDSLPYQKSSIGKFLKKKERFEEDNFIRLNLTKKQKADARRMTTITSIADDLTRFEDVSVLDIDNPNEFQQQKRRKGPNKNASKNKGKKSKRFKRK